MLSSAIRLDQNLQWALLLRPFLVLWYALGIRENVSAGEGRNSSVTCGRCLTFDFITLNLIGCLVGPNKKSMKMSHPSLLSQKTDGKEKCINLGKKMLFLLFCS